VYTVKPSTESDLLKTRRHYEDVNSLAYQHI